MNYLSAAKALDELMLELIGRGMEIPAHTVEDLKAGRSLAAIYARSPADEVIAAKAAAALENVEMNLLSLAEAQAGAAFADGWQARLAGAYQEEAPQIPPSAARMTPGVPKGAYWIRIQTSELAGIAPREELELTLAAQEDGYTLIYGKQENVQSFLQDIRKKLGKVGFKRNS